MAKMFITKRESKPIRLPAQVRDIRRRYAQALQAGLSPIEAARVANNEEEIPTRPKPSMQHVTVQEQRPADRVTIQGRAPDGPAENIPPNWQDLPWPQLRELADSVSPKHVRSRSEAHAAIEGALARRAT